MAIMRLLFVVDRIFGNLTSDCQFGYSKEEEATGTNILVASQKRYCCLLLRHNEPFIRLRRWRHLGGSLGTSLQSFPLSTYQDVTCRFSVAVTASYWAEVLVFFISRMKNF